MSLLNKFLLTSREITIENTTYCGANCIMCPRDKYEYCFEHMSTDFFKNVLDQAVDLGAISLDTCGFGDAFTDPEFERKLEYLKTKYPFMKTYVSSTCHLINSKRIIWVCKYVDTLKISMYGFSKEVYEKIHRGSLKYEKVFENISNIVSLPSGKKPYIIMLFLLLPENEHQLEEWKAYWEPKVDEIMIWKPHTFVGGYGSPIYDEQKKYPRKVKSCGRPFVGDIYVHVNGQVSVCCFDYNRKLIIGDLKNQTLREVLESKEIEKIREVHKKKNFSESDLLCKSCDQIFDRNDALLYASNRNRKVGVITTHPDMINDMMEYE